MIMNLMKKIYKLDFRYIINLFLIPVFLHILFFSYTIDSIKYNKNPYPESQFVSIHAIVEKTDNCEGYMCLFIDMIPQELGSASGLAFNSVDNKTYVLTVDHFCDITYSEEATMAFLGADLHLEVQDMHANRHKAKVVYASYSDDLCLIEVENFPIRKKIKLADSMPAPGSDIHVVSAPNGHHDPYAAIKFRGIFSGCSNSSHCLYSIPLDYGSSGSVLLDKNGRIIGMTQMMAYEFKEVTLGVGVIPIRNFLLDVENELKINLIP